MLKRYRSAAVAVSALLAISTAAYAAGLFPGLPIVGSATYCQGVSNYSTGVTVPGTLPTPNQCNSSVPAGPTIVTGNELVPADTQLASGVAPQSVYLPMASLNALPPTYYSFTVLTTPNTAIATNQTGKVVILGTGALSPTTVQFPPNPIDGQEMALTSNQTIATLTMSPNTGQTLDTQAKPTAITVSTTGSYGYQFLYRAATATWYRLQ